jgi:hypothetical protein
MRIPITLFGITDLITQVLEICPPHRLLMSGTFQINVDVLLLFKVNPASYKQLNKISPNRIYEVKKYIKSKQKNLLILFLTLKLPKYHKLRKNEENVFE